MENDPKKTLVIIANSEPYVLSSVPRMLMSLDPTLDVEIHDFNKYPYQTASDFFGCISQHAAKSRFPDALLVDHYAGTKCAREILRQYLGAAGELGTRPKVVLFSGAGISNLETEADHIRHTMPTFSQVSCLPMAARFEGFIQHIRGNVPLSVESQKAQHG